MNEINNENQVEAEEIVVDVEDTPVAGEPVVETDSGGDDELDKYTKGVSKRINKLNDKIRQAEQRAAEYESKYTQLSNEYNTVKKRASVLDKSYTEEYENRVRSQRQQAEDLYRKARETNDPELEVKSVELLNKVSLEEERVRLAKVQLENQQQQTFTNSAQTVQNVQQEVYDRPKPDSKAVEWQKNNDWFQKDRVKTYTAMGIHEDLINEGFDGHDDDYYQELDKRLLKVYPDIRNKPEGVSKDTNSTVQRVASASSGSRQGTQGKKSGIKINSNHASVKSNLKPYGMSQEEWLKRVGKEIVKLEGAK
jgi:archaellum component FlaC